MIPIIRGLCRHHRLLHNEHLSHTQFSFVNFWSYQVDHKSHESCFLDLASFEVLMILSSAALLVLREMSLFLLQKFNGAACLGGDRGPGSRGN